MSGTTPSSLKKLAAVRGGLKDSQRSQFERVKILQDPPWAELFIDEELFTLAPNPGARRVHDGVLHSVGAMAPVRGRHFFEGRAQVVPLHDGAKVRDLAASSCSRPVRCRTKIVRTTRLSWCSPQTKPSWNRCLRCVCVYACVQVLGFVGLHQLVAWSQPRVSAQNCRLAAQTRVRVHVDGQRW